MKSEELGLEQDKIVLKVAKRHKQVEEFTSVKKMEWLKKLEDSKRFLKEFLKLCSGEEFMQEIYIVRDKEGQYSIRIPKIFAEAVKINPKNDKMLFRLSVPAALENKNPILKAEIIKEWNKRKSEILVKNKPIVLNRVGSMVTEISNKFGFKECPFKNGELLIIAIMAQWKTSFKTQELADLTNQNWPTTNRYLQNLRQYNYIKSIKDKKGREKWVINSKVYLAQ